MAQFDTAKFRMERGLVREAVMSAFATVQMPAGLLFADLRGMNNIAQDAIAGKRWSELTLEALRTFSVISMCPDPYLYYVQGHLLVDEVSSVLGFPPGEIGFWPEGRFPAAEAFLKHCSQRQADSVAQYLEFHKDWDCYSDAINIDRIPETYRLRSP